MRDVQTSEPALADADTAAPATVPPPQTKTALRLVSTKGMSRETWLEVRKRGIGGSDAAAAVGISPYMSPLELWMIKTGRDELLPKIHPNDESARPRGA